ncbi:autotransporter outer membrane beta-barrel domain-containing protein [Thalassococcus sp. BH17M4-6]|uniref:DUF7933 domain-containing protein n=1 Tax=Thalassococcus sp. BH17M4-6 TaxID=3413148 RepID=UPI003BCF274B
MKFWSMSVPAFIKGAVIAAIGSVAFADTAQAQVPPVFDATIEPSTISAGGVAEITYTIENLGEPATGLAFTHNLPNGMTFASPANPQTDCRDPRVTTDLTISGTQLSLSNGAVGANTECSVTVNVTANVSVPSHLTGQLTSSLGNSGSTTVPALNVSTTLPLFSMAFSPDALPVGDVTTLTYLIENTSQTSQATLSFNHSLPSSLRFADTPNASSTCESSLGPANLTVDPGGSLLTFFANGFSAPGFEILLPGESCTVSVDVQALQVGSAVTTTSSLSTSSGTVGPATAGLTSRQPAAQLSISKDFATNPVTAGGSSELTFTLRNVSRTESATGLEFSDDLDAMLSGAVATNLVSTGCGGSAFGLGTGNFSFAGGSLGPDSSCEVVINVAIPAAAAAGTYTNTVSGLSGTFPAGAVTGDPATTSLQVRTGFPSLSFTISDADIGGVASIDFTLTNAGTAAATTDAGFEFNFGTALPGTTTANTIPSSPCGTGTLSFVTFGFSSSPGPEEVGFILSGASLAASGQTGDTCTFSASINIPADASPGPVTLTSGPATASYGGLTVTGEGGSDTFVIGGGIAIELSKSFDQSIAQEGDQVGLRFELSPSAESTAAASNLSFSDDLAAFLTGTVLASVDSNDCGGSVTGVGTTQIDVSGVGLALGASCAIETTVTLGTGNSGIFTNTAGPVFENPGSLQVSAPATDTLQILPTETVLFSKEFVGSPTAPGAQISLRYTLENTSATSAATINFFSDNLSGALPGLQRSGAPLSDTCGGTASGTTSLTYTGGSIPAAGSCVIDIPLSVPANAPDGIYSSTSTILAVSVGGSSQNVPGAFDRLVVNASPLVFSKAFAADAVNPDSEVGLVFTIENPGALPVTDIAFTDDLSSMLTGAVFGPNLIINGSCGTPTSSGLNTTALFLGNIAVAAGSTCQITAFVRTPANASAGTKTNVTSALTGRIGTGTVGAEPARAEVRVADPTALRFFQSFTGPSTATGTVGLEVSIINPSTVDVTDLAFTQDLDAALSGLVLISVDANPCGASSSLTGTSFLTFTGGSVAPGGTCTFVATLGVPAGAAAGTYPVISSPLTQGGLERSAAASANLVIEPAPTFTQVFAPATIVQGGVSTLTYTIDNTASALPATGLSFLNNLPANVVIAAPTNGSTTCTGGTGSFPVGSGSVGYSGGSVAAGSLCTVQVDVTSAVQGSFVNTTADLTSSSGNSGTSSATLAVDPAPAPVISLAANPASVEIGTPTTVTLTINNSGALVPAENISIRIPNDFGVDAVPAQPFGFTTTCVGAPGTVSGGTGGAAYTFSGYSVPAGQSCTFSTDIVPLLIGNRTVQVADVSSTLGSSGSAATQLVATAPPAPGYDLSASPATIAQGGTSDLVFEITNTASAVDMAFEINEVLHPSLELTTPFASSSTCGASVTSPSVGNVDITGTLAAGDSCEVRFNVTAPSDGTYQAPSRPLNYVYTGANAEFLAAPLSQLIVEPAPTPGFAKAFAATSIVQGDTTDLTFTIDNSGSLVPATAMQFTDVLPSGMTVAATGTPSQTCDAGTLSATPGGNFISFSAGEIAAGATCEIAVTVTAVEVGTALNESSQLQTSLGNAPLASASLEVTRAPAPGFSKAFADAAIPQGGVTTLTFTIDNSQALIAATNLNFADNFPDGLVIASVPNATSTCTGGTVVAPPDDFGVAFVGGGAVAAGATCTIAVDVTSTQVGTYDNVSLNLQSSLGTSDPATATLQVNAAPLPLFTKVFDDASVPQGVVTTLIFTIDNSAALIGTGALFFEDRFPAGMTLADDPDPQTDCTGGSFAIPTTSNTFFQFRAPDLAAGESCQVGIDVVSTRAGIANNVTSDLQASRIGDSPPATASIEITPAPIPGFSKVFGAGSIVQGEVTTLTFTIDNSAAAIPATSLSFIDSFPAGMTVAANPGLTTDCTQTNISAPTGAAAIQMSDGQVAAGTVCTVQVNVASTVVGTADNVSGPLQSSLGQSGTASASVVVTAAPAPTLSKSFGVPSMVQGDITQLTLTIDNSGALVPATNISLTDIFPAGMVVATAATGAGSGAEGRTGTTCVGGSLTANLGDGGILYSGGTVPAGGVCEITVDVTSDVVGLAQNQTEAMPTSLGLVPAASASITILDAPTPGFTKAFDPVQIAQGEVSTLTFTIDNGGALIAAEEMRLNDTFPAGLVIAADPNTATTCTGGTFVADPAGTSFAYTDGSVAAGQTCTVSVDVTSVQVGQADNLSEPLQSTLRDSAPAAASLTVTAAPSPVLTKSLGDSEFVDQGGVSTLTLTIDNTGSALPAEDVQLSDTFPSGVSVAPGAVANTTCTGGTLTAPVGAGSLSYVGGTVPALSSCEVTVGLRYVEAGLSENTTDPLVTSLGASGTASDTISVVNAPLPFLTKRFDVSNVVQGQTARVIVAINNENALVDAEAATFEDNLPAGMIVADPANAETTCAAGTIDAVPGGSLVTFSDGVVPDSETCEVRFDVRATQSGTIDNIIYGLSTSLGDNEGALATLNVTPGDTLVFNKAFDQQTALPGEVVGLTITIENPNTFLEATDVVLTDMLPAGMSQASDTVADAGCGSPTLSGDTGGSVFGLTGGRIEPGATCTVTTSVSLTGSPFGELTNTTTQQTSSLGDSAPATATINVAQALPLQASKSFDPAVAEQGQTVQLQIAVLNPNTVLVAGNAQIRDDLPDGMELVGTPVFDDACGLTDTRAPEPTDIVLEGSSMQPGATCRITANVLLSGSGTLVNTTTAPTGFNVPTGEPASASIEVSPTVPLTVAQTFDTDTALQGQVIGLTITLENPNGFVPATAAAFDDVLPAGMELASVPVADAACGAPVLTGAVGDGALGFAGGTIAPGALCTVTASVLLTGTDVLVNETSNQTSSLGDSAAASASVTVTPADPMIVTKTFAATSAVQGQSVGLTITLENPNAFQAASDVTVTDLLPDGMTLATLAEGDAACGPAVIDPLAGEGGFVLSGGTLAPGAVCTVTAEVLLTGSGTLTNTTRDQASSLGISAPASATISVTPAGTLLLTKSFASDTADQGETIGLTITVANPNTFQAASDVAFDDAFPAGMILASDPVADAACGSAVLTAAPDGSGFGFADGVIAAGGTCTVTAQVTLTGSGELTNVTSNQTSSLGASAPGRATVAVTPAAALQLTKTFATDSAVQGQTIGLSITLTNPNTLVDATAVAFDDVFPAGMVLASAPAADPACGSPALTGAAGDAGFGFAGGVIAAGAVCTVTADVRLTGSGELTNVTSNQTSSLGDSAAASDAVSVTASNVLLLSKSFDATEAAQEAVVGLTITLQNPNAFETATDVVFDDAFPEGMVLASVPSADAACGSPALTGAAGDAGFGFVGGSIAPGDLCTVSAEVRLVGTGTLTNTTSNQSSSLGDSLAATAQITVAENQTLILSKSFATDEADQGAVIGLTITVENPNPFAAASDVAFDDNFPADMVLASVPQATAACGSPTLTGATGDAGFGFAGGAVAPGGLCTVIANVELTGAGQLTNVTSNQTSSLGASAPASASIAVTGGEVLRVTKLFAAETAVQGEIVELVITLENPNTFATATDVTLTDAFPDGMVLGSIPAADEDCGPVRIDGALGDAAFSLSGGTIAPGALCLVRADVVVTGAGELTNTTSDQGSSLGASAPASASIRVSPTDVLLLSKAFDVDTAEQGQIIGMSIAVQNLNTFETATGVAFDDVFPGGMVLASAPQADAACGGAVLTGAEGAAGLSLSGGSIAPETTCTVTATVRLTGSGTLTNVTSNQTSSFGDSLAASATVTVTPIAPLTLTKSFDTEAAAQGQTIGLTITLNNGNSFATATDVGFDDAFPDGMVLVSAPVADAACGEPVLTGAQGDAGFGFADGAIIAGATCQVTADVLLTAAGELTNVTSNQTSSLGDSLAASASVTVAASQVLLLTKAFDVDTAVQGQTIGMSIAFENPNSFVGATDVTLEDVFPNGMVLATAPEADAACGNPVLGGEPGDQAITLADGSVAPGAVCTLSATVLLTGSGLLVNETLSQSSSLGDSEAARAQVDVAAANVLLLTKAFDVETALAGQTVGLSITLRNPNDEGTATDVTVEDVFPVGMILAAAPQADAACGTPALTGTAGDASFALAGGTIAPDAVCTVTAQVQLTQPGELTNVTSNQTSSLGDSIAATATITVAEPEVLTVTKAFGVASATQGETVGLTITLANPNPFQPATDVVIDDVFPAGMVLGAAPVATEACGDAVLTGAAGEGGLALSAGSIAPDAVCEVTADVVLTGVGELVNTTSNQTSSLGASAPASATVTVEAAVPLVFGKAFDTSTAVQGETIGLAITIENPNTFQSATGVTFEDPFPAGMELAGAPVADAACGSPVLTGGVGDTLLTFAGGTVEPGAICTVSAEVLITGSVSATNVTVNQGSTLGVSDAASPPAEAPLIIVPSDPLNVALAFSPAEIEQTQTSLLSITLSNPAGVEATDIGIRDTLPEGVTLATPANVTTTCPMGIVGGADGGSELSLEDATLAAGDSCRLSAQVTSSIVGTYDNTVEVQSSSLGTSGTARGALEVVPATTGNVTIVQDTDFDGEYAYSSSVPALNFVITTAGGKGRRGPIKVPVGSHLLSLVAPDGVGNIKITCNDDDSVGDARNGEITLNIDPLETVVCTVTSVESRQRTVDAINRFLTKRADLILSSEPSPNRRFARLNRGFGGSRVLNFSNGDLGSMLPFTLKASGGQNFQFSTSLVQMQEAHANFLMAHDGVDASRRVDNHRFDVWFEAQYKRFDAGSDGKGHFGIAYLGADYLLTENVLVGALVQLDDMEDAGSGTTVEGRGWMAGPYVTARIAPNLYFDGRIAAGRSSNEISPFNTYTDDLDTTRWMAMASLTGEFEKGNWTIRPSASFSYFEETQDSYVDSLGVSIPSQTVSLGQIKLGPTFTGEFESASGIPYSPYFSLDAIYNMGDTDGVTLTEPDTAATEGWRGRIKAGVDWTSEGGSRFSFGGTYDGIGRKDFGAWGLTFDVTIPLHKAMAR